MASITWEKDGQTEALEFIENSTNGYFLDAHRVVISPLLATLDADASNLIVAAAAKSKKLRLPKGTHRSSKVTGNLFNMAAAYDGLEIYGDGIGRTIIQFEDDLTLTGDTNVFAMLGWNQSVHDLSIYNGSGMSGGVDNAWSGVVASGAFYPHIYNVEVAGVFGTNTAGGAGISLYQAWNTAKYTTTLGTNIASGTRTCTPGSMNGIYKGQRLSISSPSEDVIVTAVTATTFTAVFASAHDSTDTVSVPSRGDQYATVDNCQVRDSYKATAYVVNSNQNTLKNCKAIAGGSAGTQHALYVQGGHNKFIGMYMEGWAGYHIHQYAQVANIDSSGNVYTDCESVNPGYQHGIVNSNPSTGVNPDIPNTIENGRYVTVQGCTFRCTNQTVTSNPAMAFDTPALVKGCVFEDSTLQFTSGADHSLADGNHFRSLEWSGAGQAWIYGQATYATVSNNTIRDSNSTKTGIIVGTYSDVSGNTIYSALGTGIQWGAHSKVFGNTVTVAHASAVCLSSGGVSSFDVYGNTLSNTTAAVVWLIYNTDTGRFHHNEIVTGYVRYSSSNVGMILEANTGLISQDGQASLTLTGEEGILTWFTSSAGTQPKSGYGTILNAGLAERAGTGSTVLIGIGTTDGSTGQGTYVVCQPGAVVSVIMDGAWTIGNVALPSTGTAGKWMDSTGTTQPTYRKSYGILLNSGGGAGTARMLIAQMG